MRYIESELRRRSRLGKKIAVVGLAVGLSATPALAQEPAVTEPIQCNEVLDGDVTVDGDELESPVLEGEEVVEEQMLGMFVESMPEFPGGELALRKYIADNIRYPDEPGCEDIEGVVYVQFRVDTLGNVSDVRLLRGLHPLFDAEAMRVVKTLPQFKPASLGNKPVSITHAVPVKFVKFNSNLNKKSNKNKSKITKK